MGTENRLNEDCNLIVRKTHRFWRAPWNNRVYVVDIDTFPFGSGNPMTQAKDQANESIRSKSGCSSCPIKNECRPEPGTITNYPDQNSISSAILTNFE